MSGFCEAYISLTSASSRVEVQDVLQSIISAPSFAIDDASREELIKLMLADLVTITSASGASTKSRLAVKDASHALLAIKTLGKSVVGSKVIASADNLSTMLSISNTFKDNPEASNEALRCVANALLLVEGARAVFVQSRVGGGLAAIELLEKSTTPDRIFLASRILFLSTVSMVHSASYIKSLVEGPVSGCSTNIIEIVSRKLDLLTSSLLSSERMAREAMADLLKMVFNILLHYPKIADKNLPGNPEDLVMGDCWNSKLDGILAPLLKVFNILPPTFPSPLTSPMSHVIHALITIPASFELRGIWFPVFSKSSSPSPTSPPKSPSSGSNSPTAKELKSGPFDRAFSKLSAGRRSLSRPSSPQHEPYDTVLRCHDLLEVSFSHYLPKVIDPDDLTVRQRCKDENDSTLDDIVCPLLILTTKLCKADETSRKRMREWILPDDLDRTNPLESRADLLGRCLRLLACVHHPRAKDATGELLYAVCDSDPSSLASYVGYGNVAGFLFNKGIMNAPPRSTLPTAPTVTSQGVPIDPITGIAQVEQLPVEMTDEEKEREAEKLFVLFDRLERSGAIPPEQNPIRLAVKQGKFS